MNKRKSFQVKCDINEKKIFNNNINRKNKKQTGITLIALVISIIVMLILAGVSLNATIGDNGIITQAQNATYVQSCAVLEDWLNQMYVTNYDNLENENNKIVGIMKLGADWIYQPANNGYGSLNYIVDSEGKALYLIQKNNLPEEIKNQIKGGELNGKTANYTNYLKLEDVYGVTSNLEVYYCSNGKDSIMGIDDSNLDEDEPSRTVISDLNAGLGKLLSNFDTNGDGKLSSQEVSGIKNITIDSNTGITSLNDIYNLYSLEKLTLENVNLSNLNGIENCSKLNYIFIKSSTIGDYSAIGKLGSKLKWLYFLYATNDEVNKLGEGLSNYDLPNLNYLGFFAKYDANVEYFFNEPTYRNTQSETTNLTDISGLKKLTQTTKNAIKYLYINDNKITSIETLADFSNLYYIRAQNNQITSMKGLENKNNLTYLNMSTNQLNDTTDSKNPEVDVLNSIAGNKKLYWLDLKGNQIKWISYLKECTSLKYLYLDGIETINDEDMAEIKDIIKNAKNTVYSSKYSLSLIDNNISKLDLSSQKITESQFKALKNCKNLTYLSLYNVTFTNDTGTNLNENELNNLLNEVLPNFTKLTELSLYNIKFSNMTFISKMPNIVMLDLRNTLVTTAGTTGMTLLENNQNLGVLAINNSNIDLSKIQNTVTRLAKSGATPGESGTTSHILGAHCSSLVCNNPTVIKTLENCTNITNLAFGMQSYSYYNTNFDLDLTKCTKLVEVRFLYITLGTVKLPNSVTYLTSIANNTKYELPTDSKLAQVYFRENSNIQSLLSELANKCKKLTNLEIFNNSRVTDFGVLKGCTALNILKVTGAQWTGKVNYTNINTLNNLKDLSSLKTIHFNWLTLKDLNCISDLKSLNTLQVYNTNVADISAISNLTNLTTISMTDNAITDVSAFNGLNNLTTVNLSRNFISSGINGMQNLVNLENLNISSNSLTDTSTYIDLNGKQIRYNVLEIFTALNKKAKLKTLDISNNSGIIDNTILTGSGTNWSSLKK